MRLCDGTFPESNTMDKVFSHWSFPLSNFQKHAVQSISSGLHTLVTAHTASGKTLCADYAILHHVGDARRRLIYTAPIKALNNQKFKEFKERFPDIEFGILTGDIKFNPDAEVLIMTTEILRNTLLRKRQPNGTVDRGDLKFEMDIEKELACVVFDEVSLYQ